LPLPVLASLRCECLPGAFLRRRNQKTLRDRGVSQARIECDDGRRSPLERGREMQRIERA
jgi:hypothetical protein